MASTTPLTSLPKSKSTPASVSTATTDYAAHANINHDWQTPEDPDFIHPDHVIPPPSYPSAENLVIVCCHAIFLPDAETAEFPLHSPHDERNWLLAPFQKSNPETGKPGEHETFLAHVKAGLDALTVGTDQEHPPSNLLVLSGGVTKRSQTTMSEARSYYHAVLAEELAEGHLHGGRAHHMFSKGYVLLEEQATDSLQNLFFSIILFRKTTGIYPKQIRIITHAFKSARFLELHGPAIRWPADRIQVQGIDPVMSGAELKETLHGEEQYGYEPWKTDPLGVGETLGAKRRQRGWDDSCLAGLEDGVEHSVRELLHGRVSEQLPWCVPLTQASHSVAAQ
ncbi:hypothetical protein T440DRAFT_318329 [Plenodomus tracheiphilus IPT5]|uniref:DUF218 domain-containing protein n=1 Tax=Plenodomus tracheiphilus IPT5 TaxID=1408161 RepID=A0A6A7BC15_9PLEO|nr:hypothetical protein T440DRAFT_318329 [Plenodomus tracheiphilus IPT5]